MAQVQLPRFSKYDILDVLGEGGMGTVYMARHKVLDRLVALKVPKSELVQNKKSVERFLREGRALAMLQHPHVVAVYDADEEDGIPFIAMEYIDGGTLSNYIQESRQLSISKIQRWAIQIAQALDFIHNKGILHRDLKSSNVLISTDGEALITDFGIAHVDFHATLTDGLLGTPAYMSPEQARGESLDRRSDIYSLGVILYESLTGRIPFMDENGLAMIQQIINQLPEPVETLRPDTPSWLADIVDTCLQKDPAHRFDSGGKLAIHLREKKTSKQIPLKKKLPKPSAILPEIRKRLPAPVYFIFVCIAVGIILWLFLLPFKGNPDEMQDPQSNAVEADSHAVDSTAARQSKPNWQPWPSN